MAEFDLKRLRALLNNSKLQITNYALYQTVDQLINNVKDITDTLFSSVTTITTVLLRGPRNTVLHGKGLAHDAKFETVTEDDITLADVTTLDVSITKHGLAPKAPNDATKFLNGVGGYTQPAGSGSGNVNGPVSSTTNGIATWASTTGTTLQSTSVTIVSGRITNLTDPTGAQDAATKNYVDTTPKLTILVRSTNQAITTATWTAINWDTIAVQDDVGAFSSTSPSIVTTPSGFTKVRVTVNSGWENNSTGAARYDRITKNGTADSTAIAVQTGAAQNESNKNWITDWRTVTTGDTLAFGVFQNSGSNRNFSGTGFPGTGSRIQFEWKP